MNMQRAIAAAFIGLLVLFGAACEPTPSDSAVESSAEGMAVQDRSGITIGGAAPDFQLWNLDGQPVTLSGYRGRVVLLNFWATWCGPCRAEIPSLVELQDKYRDDLTILGVSIDDPAEKLKPYADEFKMNYPVLVGNGHQDMQDAFGPLYGIPVSVIVGRDGRIAKKHSGIATKEQFEQEIKALL
jgi:thiol-disulfide isomerase/thioredoxin